MKPEYWLERWQEGRISFHRAEPNARLVEHHQRALGEVLRVLVPLCGKSVDLEWLVVRGHEVVGVELSELAAEAFFSERGITPERRVLSGFTEFSHGGVRIFCGDYFAITPSEIGYFDGVYDRAALIALPEELRGPYARKTATLLAPKARLLQITLHFDAPGGPPFTVSPEEVAALYPEARVTELGRVDGREDAPGPVERGASFVHENSYLLELPEAEA